MGKINNSTQHVCLSALQIRLRDLHSSKYVLPRLFSCGFPDKACFQFKLPLFWKRPSGSYISFDLPRWIDRFHVTSHHFRSAILVYHFRLRNPRNFSTTIIPTSKMDSKEKEKESQNKSGVDYSFPISEYAKQLDFPVRDRYLQKIAAYSVATVQLWFMKMKNS